MAIPVQFHLNPKPLTLIQVPEKWYSLSKFSAQATADVYRNRCAFHAIMKKFGV